MASEVTDKLAVMSLTDAQTVTHGACTNAAEWSEQLAKVEGVPEFKLTKTLVFKPKTPKSQTAVLVVLFALADTESPSSLVAKTLNIKEPRMAAADAVEAALGVKPFDVSPLSITKDNASAVQVAFDQRILDTPVKVAVHPSKSDVTIFVSGAEIKKYLEDTGVKLTVVDFGIAGVQAAAKAEVKKPAIKAPKVDAKIENAELIGVTTKKEVDFSGWYQQVLTKGDMLDYYDISGCYILKPWSYGIWERIQHWFDTRIKSMGVENCYFPMFVSAKVLEREKDHIEGFAPEVAWVTKAGNNELEEHIAIRPTSETVMYPYYAKWIRSHRDLPLKLNQWNSVVRWEFKHPQPFLRTREFLWQEGHTAHLTKELATEEVMQILEWYSGVYSELLAVPTVKGRKTEKEKFAGGLFTTTCEGYIPTTGRGIQGATSHCLGQNFSKMFNITVEDPNYKEGDADEQKKLFVWQNSWGLSTRVIGVMVMIHGDNKGLVIPPAVAAYQVVIVPCGITAKTTDEERKKLGDSVNEIAANLQAAGIRVKADTRETYSPGYKFNDWELKGVPLRIEYGPKDMEKKQVLSVRRDTGVKDGIPLEGLAEKVNVLLKTIQQDMYDKAKNSFDEHIKIVTKWEDFVPALNAKNVILLPHCDKEDCEDEIKERSKGRADDDAPEDSRAPSMGAKSLCIPFDQPKGKNAIVPGVTKCPQCGDDAKHYTLFGRSY
ncbi:ribose-phosphate pyrophosphokinase 1 [Rhizina undulata]